MPRALVEACGDGAAAGKSASGGGGERSAYRSYPNWPTLEWRIAVSGLPSAVPGRRPVRAVDRRAAGGAAVAGGQPPVGV